MVAAVVCLWGSSSGVFVVAALLAGRNADTGETWADYVSAYGPVFYYFLLCFAAAVVLSVALRRQGVPYEAVRTGGDQTSSI